MGGDIGIRSIGWLTYNYISLENNDMANFSILHPDCCFYLII